MNSISYNGNPEAKAMFDLGLPGVDKPLRGGLERACLHEVVADASHFATAVSFGLALVLRALHRHAHCVWARQDAAIAEVGSGYGPGLVEFGLEPHRLAILNLHTPTDVLRVGIEAALCSAVGAVILEVLDGGCKVDLTATRRLKLAAEKSGVTIFLIRPASRAMSSAAQTRWLARPALSRTFCAHGPGRPRFDVTLLRHRAGLAEMRWYVEWNRDRRVFEQTVSQPVVSVPVGRSMAA